IYHKSPNRRYSLVQSTNRKGSDQQSEASSSSAPFINSSNSSQKFANIISVIREQFKAIFDRIKVLDSECGLNFRKVIKQATKESRCSAIKSLLAELTNDQMLDENMDYVILENLKTLPTEKIKNKPSEITFITNYLDRIMREIFHNPDKHIVEWPNTGLDEEITRKKQTTGLCSIYYPPATEKQCYIYG
ncbi:842_t:CDS:2, partial [Paraglomus occultum]